MNFFIRKKEQHQPSQQSRHSEKVVQGPLPSSVKDQEPIPLEDPSNEPYPDDTRATHRTLNERPLERGILDSLIANICVVDAEGTIVAVNRAWNRFAEENSYVPEDSATETLAYGIGRNYFDICQNALGDDAEAARETAEGLKKILGGSLGRFSIEYPCHAPDQQRWYLLTISPISSEEGGAIISHFNITEQTELRRANEQLDAFAQSLALDFRTPLAKMSSSLHALRGAGTTVPAELQPHIRSLTEATGRLDSMVQDLLAYSRINRLAITLRPVDLGQVVEDALSRFSEIIRNSGARLIIAEEFPRVMADQMLLTDAVAALISNALKFVPSGVSPEISVHAEHHTDAVWLSIEDRGTGIREEDRHHIFNIFQRSRKSEEYSGNGIGLAIVRKSMAQMGGSVEALPRKDGGSCLRLIFPKQRSSFREKHG